MRALEEGVNTSEYHVSPAAVIRMTGSSPPRHREQKGEVCIPAEVECDCVVVSTF